MSDAPIKSDTHCVHTVPLGFPCRECAPAEKSIMQLIREHGRRYCGHEGCDVCATVRKHGGWQEDPPNPYAEITRLKALIKAAEKTKHHDSEGEYAECPWCHAEGDFHADECPAFTYDGEVR